MIFAISSLGVYGVIMSGWASIQSMHFWVLAFVSTMISYEVSMGLLIMPVILLSGTAIYQVLF